MFKVLKNLKKTWVSVLMIIILLCIQAATDLALPEYTSKIVNIGIQQGGIENTIPEIVRETTMKSLELIAGQEKDTIINSYTKISKENLSNNEYEKYVKKYPALEKENLYVVNDLSKEEKEKLNSVISKLLIAIYSQKMAAQMQNQNENYLSDNSMNSLRQSQMEEMPDSIIEQIAIQKIKSEYEDIGINMENYQINYILMTGLQMLGIALISMATAVIIMLDNFQQLH